MRALHVSTSLSLHVEMDPILVSCLAFDLGPWTLCMLALSSLLHFEIDPCSASVHGFHRDFLDALYVSTGPAASVEMEIVFMLRLALNIVSRHPIR